MTNEQNAERLANAIRQFAEHPERLENFQAYLERHFTAWMRKFASDPDGLAEEFRNGGIKHVCKRFANWF